MSPRLHSSGGTKHKVWRDEVGVIVHSVSQLGKLSNHLEDKSLGSCVRGFLGRLAELGRCTLHVGGPVAWSPS